METIRIDIVNPKAKRILKELADLDWIANPRQGFHEVLSKAAFQAKKQNEQQSPG